MPDQDKKPSIGIHPHVPFTHFGLLRNRPRHLRLEVNAMRAIERELGKPITRLLSEETFGVDVLCVIIWGGLKWEDRTLTPDKVGDMITEFMQGGGDMTQLSATVLDGLRSSGLVSLRPQGDTDDADNDAPPDESDPNEQSVKTL